MLRQWQLYILFFVGVFGIIFELSFPSDIRPLAIVTDLILIGLLPVDVAIRAIRHHNGGDTK